MSDNRSSVPLRDPPPRHSPTDGLPGTAEARPVAAWVGWLLGPDERVRTRVSQSLLGVPSLLLIQALLLLRWQQGQLDGAVLACFSGLTLLGCLWFVAMLRSGLSERLSAEPSLSAPQMGYAMVCVGWGYALAGPARATLLCLMPVILCFGLFALRPRAARALALFGGLGLGLEMAVLAVVDAPNHPLAEEVTHFAFLSMSLAMVQALALRLGRIRARISAQKAELGQALERISLLATRDALTGLPNRRAAEDELRIAAAGAARERRPLVVALADLDHFKQVNDRFGHHAGDHVLQLFARVAQQSLRGSDRVARWGGEEFVFILPSTAEEEACIALQRLREAFTAASADAVPPPVRLSFSAGLACCTGPGDIEAALERADRALYAAKQAGRARTHRQAAQACAPSPPCPAPMSAE